MRDFISIGPSPAEEECAQVGTEGFDHRNKMECVAYEAQLIRLFGEPPQGAYLAIKAFQHEFGTYREVVCYFDDNHPESIDYAFKLEGNSPAKWDDQARKEVSSNDALGVS